MGGGGKGSGCAWQLAIMQWIHAVEDSSSLWHANERGRERERERARECKIDLHLSKFERVRWCSLPCANVDNVPDLHLDNIVSCFVRPRDVRNLNLWRWKVVCTERLCTYIQRRERERERETQRERDTQREREMQRRSEEGNVNMRA